MKKISGNNYTVMVHSNGLALLCVDPTHAALPSLTVSFSTPGDDPVDRLAQAEGISGKRKRGALRCGEGTLLGTVTSTVTGTIYPITACMNGTLIELNTQVLANPAWVVTEPYGRGFLATLCPPKGVIQRPLPSWQLVASRVTTDEGVMDEEDH